MSLVGGQVGTGAFEEQMECHLLEGKEFWTESLTLELLVLSP